MAVGALQGDSDWFLTGNYVCILIKQSWLRSKKEKANPVLRKFNLFLRKLFIVHAQREWNLYKNKTKNHSNLFDCLLIFRVEVKDQCSVKPKTGDQDDQLWLSLDSMIIMIPMITMVIIFILMIMIKMIMMIMIMLSGEKPQYEQAHEEAPLSWSSW